LRDGQPRRFFALQRSNSGCCDTGLTLLGGVELGGAIYRYGTATSLIVLLCCLARIVFLCIALGLPLHIFPSTRFNR
jgi:hypothetical protein